MNNLKTDIGKFVMLVGSHWVGLLAGTPVAVVLFLAEAAGVTVGRFWYSLALVVAALGASFLVWRDEHRVVGELRSSVLSAVGKAPSAALRVVADGADLYVLLQNDSHVQAEYLARCEVQPALGGIERFDAAWRDGRQGWRLIPGGGTERIKFATAFLANGIYQWGFHTPRQGDDSGVRTALLRADARHVRFITDINIRLEVVAKPQLHTGSEVLDIRISGDSLETSSGEKLRHLFVMAQPMP